jgi:hypothetical protein
VEQTSALLTHYVDLYASPYLLIIIFTISSWLLIFVQPPFSYSYNPRDFICTTPLFLFVQPLGLYVFVYSPGNNLAVATTTPSLLPPILLAVYELTT